MKKIICYILIISTLLQYALAAPVFPELAAPSAILIEKETGTVLYEKESHSHLPPASVTKVMTLLLVMESIKSGKISFDDIVTVSEYAAGMGGSQVFLSPGEQMSVHELLKATVVSSGNDSAVALAEHIAGSETGFVEMMNQKARDLGMADTTFKNCTGLDTEGHITSANDIAVMSRELIKHDKIKEYTKIWTDSIRDGKFQLANTNKLIRTYKGITGLKTGSTSIAKFCLSATAERDGMELIAVIMAAPDTKTRFREAASLLNYGFANSSVYQHSIEQSLLPELTLEGGTEPSIRLQMEEPFAHLFLNGENTDSVKYEVVTEAVCEAPIHCGQILGAVVYKYEDREIGRVNLVAVKDYKKAEFRDIMNKTFQLFFTRETHLSGAE